MSPLAPAAPRALPATAGPATTLLPGAAGIQNGKDALGSRLAGCAGMIADGKLAQRQEELRRDDQHGQGVVKGQSARPSGAG